MSILQIDDAKQQLGIDLSDGTVDDELIGYIGGITAAVENYLHEVIEQRTITERLQLNGRRIFRLWHVPVIDLQSLVSIDGTATWDAGDFDVDPDTGLVETLTGSRPAGRVLATYTAGYETVPDNYKQGALVILQHVWETQRGVGQVPGGVIGREEYANRDPALTYSIPRKAFEWLGPPRPVVA